MQVTALRPFAHDAYRAAKGDELDMTDATAADLEKAGFVTTGAKKAPPVQNKMAQAPSNKGTGK